MARVTVEDCILKIPNRFELVMLAAQRARSVAAGAPLTVERDNDKNPVIALREIAEETINLETLEDNFIKSLQKHVEVDEPEEDELDREAIQQEMSGDAETKVAKKGDSEAPTDEIVEAEDSAAENTEDGAAKTDGEGDADDSKTASEEN